MNIPPSLMLAIGITAGVLFLAVFIISAFITMRNRRLIQKHSSGTRDRQNS